MCWNNDIKSVLLLLFIRMIFIVESSFKAKRISQILGTQWNVLHTNGHLFHFMDFDLSLINSFTPLSFFKVFMNFMVPIQKNFHSFQQLLSQSSLTTRDIFIGTDADRVGDLIAFSFFFRFFPFRFHRTYFNQINLFHISNSFSLFYTPLFFGGVLSSIARIFIDYSIGFLISPFLSRYFGV